MVVVMVRHIMTVPMQGPRQVLFETVRMPVAFDHLQVVLDGFKHRGRVSE